MASLQDKGAQLDLTLRAGCDFQFTIDVAPYDLTGTTAVMNIDYNGEVHPLPPLAIVETSKIYVDIPNTVTAQLPPQSRYIIRITEVDGDVKPLAFGTIMCLSEPE